MERLNGPEKTVNCRTQGMTTIPNNMAQSKAVKFIIYNEQNKDG